MTTTAVVFVRFVTVKFRLKLCFLANAKKSGQNPGVKGGIYLDELHDEPELTALYLYGRKTYETYLASLVCRDNDKSCVIGPSLFS